MKVSVILSMILHRLYDVNILSIVLLLRMIDNFERSWRFSFKKSHWTGYFIKGWHILLNEFIRQRIFEKVCLHVYMYKMYISCFKKTILVIESCWKETVWKSSFTCTRVREQINKSTKINTEQNEGLPNIFLKTSVIGLLAAQWV